MFKKRKKTAFDRIEFILCEPDIDVFKLADKLLKGKPLILNFENQNEIESNKIITFLSGITYAIDGEIEVIKEQIFLFATKQDYKDGSLRKFVNEYKE
ncbi:cell division protein SepF [Candidatus Xianfuyuplasma coldseepsis]|uniref:Cell division protein SepF n=1 Tax=Candidatus Xianfuyuplasma coldseepsis TaxID=2782163 RepID=A0A7L7KSP5_9MOLU|nr:cell division protein SepF [Xianfuyuplasma coldseepsis]QMS85840.1 cell division protein SepF [Xianfuyuplasma coldseepsis]